MHKFILHLIRLICAMTARTKHASSPRGAGGAEPSPAFSDFLHKHLEEQKLALIRLIETGEWEDDH